MSYINNPYSEKKNHPPKRKKYGLKLEHRSGQKDSTMSKALASNLADLGSIPDTPYGPLSLSATRSDPLAQSKE